MRFHKLTTTDQETKPTTSNASFWGSKGRPSDESKRYQILAERAQTQDNCRDVVKAIHWHELELKTNELLNQHDYAPYGVLFRLKFRLDQLDETYPVTDEIIDEAAHYFHAFLTIKAAGRDLEAVLEKKREMGHPIALFLATLGVGFIVVCTLNKVQTGHFSFFRAKPLRNNKLNSYCRPSKRRHDIKYDTFFKCTDPSSTHPEHHDAEIFY